MNIFIAGLSDSRKKLHSLKKLSPLPDLSFQYMKTLVKSEKLRAFIAPNMIDLITFLGNNRKPAVYTGG